VPALGETTSVAKPLETVTPEVVVVMDPTVSVKVTEPPEAAEFPVTFITLALSVTDPP
jgi:hypothetical protein